MENHSTHIELSRALSREMAMKASVDELRRVYEETMFQQFISMRLEELQDVIWHG